MLPLRRILPRRFASETGGSVTVETLIIFPMLAWALTATVVFFDGFRTRTQSQAAAQVVGDLLSREANMFTVAYLEGMNNVYDYLAGSRLPTRLRVSSVIWNSTLEQNALQWSYGTRGLAPLPPETFQDLAEGDYQTLVARFGNASGFSFASAAAQAPVEWLADRIPPILPGEAMILVEAFALWSPFASVGVGEMRFAPIVATRPRFSPWINMEGAVPVFPEADYEVVFAGYTPVVPVGVPPEPVDPPPSGNTVVTQNFNTGTPSGWSNTTTTATQVTGINTYLGPFSNETWTTPLTLPVNLGSADRASARIEFDLLILDSWDGYDTTWAEPEGDVLQFLINGVPIASNVFVNWSGGWSDNTRTSTVNHEGAVYSVTLTRTQSGTNFAGNPSCTESWCIDSIWRAVIDIQAPPQNFTLGFAARLQGVGDESFGIDNFSITWGSGSRQPAAFTANAGNMLSADPHTRFRRYSGCPDTRIATNWLTIRQTDLSGPVRFRREVGGSQRLRDCPGIAEGDRFFSAQPAFVLNYINDAGSNGSSNGQRLRIRMDDGDDGDDCNSVILLRDPNGQLMFNNNLRNFGDNAGLALGNAPTGLYHVFLGRHQNGTCRTDVIIERY